MPLLFWCEQGQSGIILERWVQALSVHIFTSKPNPTSDISRSAAGWEVERQDLVRHGGGVGGAAQVASLKDGEDSWSRKGKVMPCAWMRLPLPHRAHPPGPKLLFFVS